MVDDAKPGMELCRAVAPFGAIKVDAGVKAKARQEAQKAKAQARKGSIPVGIVQQLLWCTCVCLGVVGLSGDCQ
jgi:hypothetical protein